MAFVDHLEELRWHILRSLLVIIIVSIFVFLKMDLFFDQVIIGPIRPDFVSYEVLCTFSRWCGLGESLCLQTVNLKLQATTFGSQFMTSISIAFVSALIISFPYLFWEIWRFIKPALNARELQSSRFAIWFVSLFFFTGAAFGYYVLAPFTFSFLGNYTLGTMHMLETRPTLSDYIDNLMDITLGSAIAFQLPVVAYVLTKIGLITPVFLKTYRKYAYVGILVVAAVITPSYDWSSQMIVFIPLAILYEISIFISKRVFSKLETV